MKNILILARSCHALPPECLRQVVMEVSILIERALAFAAAVRSNVASGAIDRLGREVLRVQG